MEDLSGKKRVREESDESDSGSSPEVKRLRDDLFGFLDDTDVCTTASQDLDSFMKSFEDEISASSTTAATVVDLTSDSGESQPELGYLLEASDDELGLPPSTTSPSEMENREVSELNRVSSDSTELSELWGFDEHITGYDSFGIGFGDSDGYNNGEYVALDGLFDYSDLGFATSEFLWRPETLPAQ